MVIQENQTPFLDIAHFVIYNISEKYIYRFYL